MRRTFITALAVCMLISGCSPAVQGNVPMAPLPPTAEEFSAPAAAKAVSAPEPTPDWQSGEGWFLGDWAGVITVGYGAEGFMEEGIDFGTMTRLGVYSGGELIFEKKLPLYTYYHFTPRFSDRLQTDTPGEIYLQCETGGTGNEIPVYRVTIEGRECEVEYLGLVDVYS